MANLLGKNEILEIKVASAWLPVGCLTTNSINRTIDVQDGTVTKCDDSPAPVLGRKTYEVTFDAVAVEDNTTKASYLAMVTAMNDSHANNTAINWRIATKDSASVITYEYGRAYLTSLSKEAPVDGEVTFSGTLQGIGEITATDPTTTSTSV